MSRICIVVLGMHRSGTSALTRMLNLLGAALPKHLMPPNPSNEMGHWEPERLVAVHNLMLAEAGSRWDDWRGFDPQTLDPERLAHYEDQIFRITTEEYGDAPLFVVKDPRLCRMAPLWRKIMRRVGAETRFVIPVRNPIEVARSLQHRDNFSLAHGYLMWLRGVLDAERETRGTRRVFVHFEDLLRDPAGICARITSRLGDWPAINDGLDEKIGSAIVSRLRHHFARQEDLRHPVPFHSWLSQAYEAYGKLVESPMDEKAQRQLDRVGADFDLVTTSFAPIIQARETALKESDEKIILLQQSLRASEAELSERETRMTVLSLTLSASEAALEECNGKIVLLQQSLQASEAELKERETMMEAQWRALSATETALRERDAAIRALYCSTSWRVTTPLRVMRRYLELLSSSVSAKI